MGFYSQMADGLFQIAGFGLFVTLSVIGYGDRLSDSPPQKKLVGVKAMPVEERADLGERIIFGVVGGSTTQGAIGKGQCPLCHGFQEGFLSERAPNLWGIPYKKRNKASALEYLAESHVCPSCYVVGGFSHGRSEWESSMPAVHKPPISLTIDELIAIDTWIYYREGLMPPTPQEIEEAYMKLIPRAEWPEASDDPEIYPGRWYAPPVRPDVVSNLTGQEPVDVIFAKALCFACHTIPEIPGAVGVVGPKLVMKNAAPERIKDSTYKGKARNTREYIIESIVDPSVYVIPGYPDNIMPKDYGKKLTGTAIDKMADYLSQLEEGKEPPKIE